jgi:hypothetical protein
LVNFTYFCSAVNYVFVNRKKTFIFISQKTKVTTRYLFVFFNNHCFNENLQYRSLFFIIYCGLNGLFLCDYNVKYKFDDSFRWIILKNNQNWYYLLCTTNTIECLLLNFFLNNKNWQCYYIKFYWIILRVYSTYQTV